MNDHYTAWEHFTIFLGIFAEGLGELFLSAGWFIPVCFLMWIIGSCMDQYISGDDGYS